MIIKEHKTTILAVVISVLACGCIHFATSNKIIIPIQKDTDIEAGKITHPFTHCIAVAMQEARQSGSPCTIKEAKSICHRLQEPANYKKRKEVEADEVKE